MVKKLNIKESLGVPDYYGLYIEPDNDDGFIIYNYETAVIKRMERRIKDDWFWLHKETTDEIKEYLTDEGILLPSDFNEFINEDDIDVTNFNDSSTVYFLDNKQIQIVKSFM